MYDIILMDLDNTILDFDAAERDGFTKLVTEAGLPYTDELLQKYQEINTALWRDLEQGNLSKEVVLNTRFHTFFQLYGIEADGELWESKYRLHLDHSSGLVPHAKCTLDNLRKMGKKIYSASNGIYTTQIKRLTNAGILSFFDGHFISDQIKSEKPSLHFFESCTKNLGTISKKTLLMVGDNPISDIMGAENAGIDSCFYQHNKHVTCNCATYTITDLSELLDIV